MPPQASAHNQRHQAVKSNQLAGDVSDEPDPTSLLGTVNKVDTQELQSAEDGTLQVASRKVLPAQVDSSIACFTVGRPPLYAGADEDPHEEEGKHTTRGGTAPGPAVEDEATTHQPTSAVPLPKRCTVRASAGSVLRTTRSGKDKISSRVSTTTLGQPVENFRSTATLDCTRWTGNGPEDCLTDVAIKDGYVARYRASNETAAKTLLPHLKNGVGLAAISALFTDVLTGRQEAGRIDAPSTFKPPPRVTLTDTKREAWLKDLANPDLPLKRLSRMIPHGLRGRALLDQCLIKQIPVERAVWLAQCVGANDLRAFRRKGISGGHPADNDLKWNLEWTNIVEAFIDDCIGLTPQPDWKTKVSYAVRITSSLFVNHLLSKDHFLSWLLEHLSTCSQQALVIWLALVLQYLKFIVQDCSRAKRLAKVLFTRNAQLMGKIDQESCSHIKQRMMRLIYALVTNLPTCILMPEEPQLCQKVLKDLESGIRRDDVRTITRSISNRNRHVVTRIGGNKNTVVNTEMTLDIYLDNLSLPCDIGETSSACMRFGRTISGPCGAVARLLKWASNAYNDRQHRKYLAFSILTRWAEDGFNLTDYILELLPCLDQDSQLDCHVIGRIVAELARKSIFNAANALRWFIVNGSISGAAGSEQLSCTRAVLLNIPESVLAPSVINIRRMLIRSAGSSRSKETERVEQIKHLCEQKFELMRKPFSKIATSKEAQVELEDEDHLSCSSIFDLTYWLSSECDTTLAHVEPLDELQVNTVARRAVFILNTIDQLGDYCALIDCCHQAIAITHVDILACIADILWRNFDCLMSITASVNLPRLVLDKYCLVRATLPPSRLVVDPLLATFRLLHTKGRITEYLEHEVILWNQNLTITASSPLSDFQAETPQTGFNLLEDLENIVASCPALDEHCTQRVFSTLTAYWDVLELNRGGEVGVMILISHLKQAYTEDLAREWLQNMLLTQSLLNGAQNIPTFIRIGCFTTKTFVAAALDVYKVATIADPARAATLAIVILRAMTGIIGRICVNEQNEVDKSESMSPWTADFVYFLQACLFMQQEQFVENLQVLFGRPFVFVFARMLSQGYQNVEKILDIMIDILLADENATSNLLLLVRKLLDPLGNYALSTKSSTDVIKHIFETARASFAPIYRFALKCLLSIERQYNDYKAELSTGVLSVIRNMARRGDQQWTMFLFCLESDVLSRLGKSAADHLLSSSNNMRPSIQLDTLQATVSHLPAELAWDICDQAIKYLKNFINRARNINENGHLPAVTIQTLVEICLMHKRTFLELPEAQTLKEHFVYVLCQLVAGLVPGLPAATLEFVLDVAALFVQDLSPSTKQQLSTDLGPTILNHPTIRFLLGLNDWENGWLYAVSEQEAGGAVDNKEEKHAFVTKPWEMLVDATPVVGVNDTALSLGLFGARRV